MSLHAMVAEARRLSILQALAEDTDHTVSELILRRWVANQIDDASRDTLRADMLFLERENLVRIERTPASPAGEVWRAKLLAEGLAVTRGRRHPGVAEPELG